MIVMCSSSPAKAMPAKVPMPVMNSANRSSGASFAYCSATVTTSSASTPIGARHSTLPLILKVMS